MGFARFLPAHDPSRDHAPFNAKSPDVPGERYIEGECGDVSRRPTNAVPQPGSHPLIRSVSYLTDGAKLPAQSLLIGCHAAVGHRRSITITFACTDECRFAARSKCF
jgi:hypothetical protein